MFSDTNWDCFVEMMVFLIPLADVKGWSSCPTSSLAAICNPTISENFKTIWNIPIIVTYMFTAGQAAIE